MRRLVVFSLLLAIVASVGPASSTHGQDYYVLTLDSTTFVPGGDDRPDVLVIPQGSHLWYQNLHVSVFHDLQHYVVGDEEQLFKAETMPAWNLRYGFEPEPVVGVEDLDPGTYPFFCSHHPKMRGTLIVV